MDSLDVFQAAEQHLVDREIFYLAWEAIVTIAPAKESFSATERRRGTLS